jgi:hypothetical protein
MALNGTLMDSLSLITARTSSDALYLSEIVKYGTPLAYVLEIVAAAILAHVFLKTKHGNDDRSFLFYCFLMMVLLFLIPGAPQYHLLLIPFLIMIAICADAKLRIPMAILFVTASVHMLSPLVMDFLSLTMYTDLMSLDAWTSFYNMFAFHSDFMDMPGFDLWSTIIGIIDLIALILVAVTTFVRLLSKRTESALDGLR